MQRARSNLLGKRRCHDKRGGNEAFHVARATTVKAAVALSHFERIGGPILIRHRHHVAMTRQHDAAIGFRPKRCKKIGFVSGLVFQNINACTGLLESIRKIVDHRQVAVGGHGRKGDQV